MGKTSNRAVQTISGFKGQNSGSSPDSVSPEYAELIRNMVSVRGSLKKVNGRELFSTLSGSGNTTMLEYYARLWLAQRGTTLFREDLPVGSQTFSSIKTLTSSDTLRSTRWKDSIYMCNGRDVIAYNFNLDEVKRLGVYPPLGTVSNGDSSIVAGGSLTTDVVYRWTITYFDPDTGSESPAINSRPGAYGVFVQDPYADSAYAPDYWEETPTAGNLTVSITFAALNAIFSQTGNKARDSRCTHFKLYRTTGGGTIFRQVGAPRSIADFIAAAAALTDGTADSTLGVVLATDGQSPPPRFESIDEAINDYLGLGLAVNSSTVRSYIHIREFKDSLLGFGAYGIGVASATEENAFSPYQSILYIHDTFLPDYVFTTRDVADGDGQLPTGVAVLKDNTAILLKERSAYYLAGTNVRNYEVRPLDTRRGCAATGSIQETPFGVLCLDRSGVVLFDGIGPAKNITDPLMDDEVAKINFDAASTIYSVYDSDLNLYYLSVPTSGATKPNRTLIYNALDQAWTVSSGLEGYAIGSGIDPDGNRITLVSDSYNTDKIYDWSSETNVLNEVATIEAEYLSPVLYCGDPSVKKKAKFVYIMAECHSDYTIDIGILPDFGQYNGEYQLTDINSGSSFAVYAATLLDSGVNVGVFDESNFSGDKIRKMIKVPVYSVGYGFQIRIKHRSDDPDEYGFRLLSVKLEVVELGK